jgi:dihydroxyacetone kinase-like predicted kinase
MLTVFREMAHSISRRLAHMDEVRLSPDASPTEQDVLLAELLEDAVREGEAAVARTPDQLEILRESGVVDAGAYGLVVILAGVVAGLRGDSTVPSGVPHYAPASDTRPHHEDSRYRYCTNFIVTGMGLDSRSFAPRLEELGDSVLVVGDEATLKVHVHTDEPEAAMALFEGTGQVSQLDVADMREQIAERTARLQAGRCAAVAVVSGRGVRELYEGLGAFVVDGGETFNPSIYDLLAAIHEVPAEEVLVFPNNPNVVMAAERAAELSDKQARVVPCTSQQAGVAALVELNPTASIDENEERVGSALTGIRAGSVARASRDDKKGRFVTGDAVGFVEDEIVAWGGAGSTLGETIACLAEGAEIVTVIAGEGAPIALGELDGPVPEGIEVELHDGGQPNYWWLLAAQ